MPEKRKDSKGRNLRNGESQRSNGTYMYRYIDQNGDKKWCYASTLQELRQREDEIAADMRDGIDPYGGETTVLELVERYLEQKVNVRESTKKNHCFPVSILRREAYFGNKKIKNVRPSDAKLFFIHLHEKYHYTYWTMHVINNVIRPAFEMAVDDGCIRRNPFRFSISEVVPNDGEGRCALTHEQRDAYLAFVQSNEQYARCYNDMVILLETGMRVSELYGLTFADVDLVHRIVKIDHQLQVDHVDKLKTKSSVRTIPLSPAAVAAFTDAIRNRRKPKVEVAIDGYVGFIFLNYWGRPRTRDNLEHCMRKALADYNATHAVQLPNITPHVFRHTFITEMYNRGMDVKCLQELAGHSDVATTLGVYTHSNHDRTVAEFYRVISE